ncbi:MAG: phosphomannomutase/phosphoglucomutase, partial [Hydrogenovibrio crunogenus]|nr:phosphomannomutase/phosphoglucomutase [Hydrogenovibrio crunogenus]
MPHVEPSIFRTYDIRGIVDHAFTEETVELIGKALGSELVRQKETEIVLGRDGRLSGERFSKAITKGLLSVGVNVIDLGQVMTPMVYFAAETLPNVRSCVVMTGSHNPPNYNGIKMVIKGMTLYGGYIQALLKRILQNDFVMDAHFGRYSQHDIAADYQHRIVSGIHLARPLKIVVDAGNGVAGAYAPQVFRKLGCDVIELFCDVDGHFPNHHPDPAKLKNLQDLSEKVIETQADIGFAFDGDGDRCGVVDNQGQSLYPDRQM